MAERREEILKLLQEPEALDEDLRREILEYLLRLPRPRRMTYEEFLAWADEDTLAEWVNGEVVEYTPASRKHQNIADFLTAVLRTFVEARQLGVVLSAPFQMKLAQSGREPDLMFVAKEHLDRLQETHLEGPADLVVEILSPESMGRDRGEKFYEYAQAGIPEYWLIDPEGEQAEFYVLKRPGRYQVEMAGSEGIYHSSVIPGFWLKIEWLWKTPRVLDVLRELGVI